MRSPGVALLDSQAPPRVRVAPAGVRGNAWEDVADLAATFGLVLDGWQEDVLRAAMGERTDGRWAAKYVGLSVPRQNGKSLLMLTRALAGALLFDERKVIISAHQQGTARETFDRFVELYDESSALQQRVKQVINALNREEIRFANGAKIQFKARQGATGRGFSADCLLLDEAQILGARQWASINSTMSARGNPQAWLLGTPPTPEDDSEVFTRLRASVLAGKVENFAYLEWSAERGDDPAEEETRAKANPAWYERINPDVVQGEYETYSPEQFARERLGIWDDDTATGVIDLAHWDNCRADLEDVRNPVVLVVETSPDRRSTVLLTVGATTAGMPQVEVVPPVQREEPKPGEGTSWVASRVREVLVGSPDISHVVVDSMGAAASLVPAIQTELDGARLTAEVVEVSGPEYVDACGLLFDAIRDGRLRHGGGPVLTRSVKAALKRERDAVWVWDRRRMGAAGSALVAMTLGLGVWVGLEDYDPMMSVL